MCGYISGYAKKKEFRKNVLFAITLISLLIGRILVATTKKIWMIMSQCAVHVINYTIRNFEVCVKGVILMTPLTPGYAKKMAGFGEYADIAIEII